MLVNSLVDANTDGVIMMLDWANAYDSVSHVNLKNVVFCMGCDGIGLQRLMSTAKGFTLRVIGSQSVSEPFSRERGVGQGCPLVPLLFALAIEPLSRMLKQTMTGMQIHHIHVKQDTTHTVVAMCTDDTTHFQTIHQSNPLSFTLSTLTKHALARDHSTIVPASLF